MATPESATTAAEHSCCYHVAAAKAVLADRERELLELKGPCRGGCRLHYAHSGPCDIRAAHPRVVALAAQNDTEVS